MTTHREAQVLKLTGRPQWTHLRTGRKVGPLVW